MSTDEGTAHPRDAKTAAPLRGCFVIFKEVTEDIRKKWPRTGLTTSSALARCTALRVASQTAMEGSLHLDKCGPAQKNEPDALLLMEKQASISLGGYMPLM